MATYKDIKREAERISGASIETCWIAHVKEDFGMPLRQTPNRKSPYKRIKPCPPDKKAAIQEAMRRLGMLTG
jgi:hypothetical protein